MTLNVTMRQGTVGMQPQQQRWSIPADGRHLMVQKEPHQYSHRNRHSAAPEDHCRRSWSSDSTDSVISSESGNTYYRVVLIGEQGVGKSTLANIFAGVHDSMDSDCEVLGGRCPSPSGLLSIRRGPGRKSEGGWLIYLQSWELRFMHFGQLMGELSLQKSPSTGSQGNKMKKLVDRTKIYWTWARKGIFQISILNGWGKAD